LAAVCLHLVESHSAIIQSVRLSRSALSNFKRKKLTSFSWNALALAFACQTLPPHRH
jgi:predicted XRE-type DNA-binding protein